MIPCLWSSPKFSFWPYHYYMCTGDARPIHAAIRYFPIHSDTSVHDLWTGSVYAARAVVGVRRVSLVVLAHSADGTPYSSFLFLFDICLMEPLRCSVARRRDVEPLLSELRLSSFPDASLLGDSVLSLQFPAKNKHVLTLKYHTGHDATSEYQLCAHLWAERGQRRIVHFKHVALPGFTIEGW
jgi:hypothetical protein